MPNELREVVAEAICNRRYGEPLHDDVFISPTERKGCFDLADAAIAAMLKAMETPSEAMERRGDLESGDCIAIWQAMLTQFIKEQSND